MTVVVWENSIYRKPPVWPLATLEVGQAYILKAGDSRIKTARQYAYIRGRDLGFKFSCRKTTCGGLAIIRIK